MHRVIYREFLKALPRRTVLWATGIWVAFLVWGLVFMMGNNYLSAAERLRVMGNMMAPDQVREQVENYVKGFPILLSPQFAPSHAWALFAGPGLIIVAVIASKLFGDEYSLGTIRRLWTEGCPRAVYLGGKLGAICLVVLAGMVLTCLVAVLLTAVVRWFYPIPVASAAELPSLGQRIGQFTVQWVVSLVSVLFIGVLSSFTALATRSAVVGAVFWIILGSIETVLPPQLQFMLPHWHVQALRGLAFPEFVARPGLDGVALPSMVQLPPAGPQASLAVSLTALTAYLLLLISLLHIVTKRQEVQ